MGANVAVLPSVIVERARKEAKKLGISLEEYLLELISRDLDPKNRAIEYIKVSEELLEQARDELRKDNVRQAAEKVWRTTALAVKAYAIFSKLFSLNVLLALPRIPRLYCRVWCSL